MANQVTDEILEAKAVADPGAYLWVHTSGDVILWPDEASSVNDDGAHAIGRWQVDDAEIAVLIDSGDVDDVA